MKISAYELILKELCSLEMLIILAMLLFTFRKGFTIGYDLLTRSPRTGCQSIIVFVTDGKDTDAESVRCGPGKALS